MAASVPRLIRLEDPDVHTARLEAIGPVPYDSAGRGRL